MTKIEEYINRIPELSEQGAKGAENAIAAILMARTGMMDVADGDGYEETEDSPLKAPPSHSTKKGSGDSPDKEDSDKESNKEEESTDKSDSSADLDKGEASDEGDPEDFSKFDNTGTSDVAKEQREFEKERALKAGKKALEKHKDDSSKKSDISRLDKAISTLEETDPADKEATERAVETVWEATSNLDKGAKKTSEKAEKERKGKIKKMLSGDKNDLEDITAEDEINKEEDDRARAFAARKKELEASRLEKERLTKESHGIQHAGADVIAAQMKKLIGRQITIAKTEVPSYSALNRRHAGSSIIAKGTQTVYRPMASIPKLNVYMDASGSFSVADFEECIKLTQALLQYETKGELELNIFYVAEELATTREGARTGAGGTENFELVAQHISTTKPENVLIMTDSHADLHLELGRKRFGKNFMTFVGTKFLVPEGWRHKVPGCVWYINKNTSGIEASPSSGYVTVWPQILTGKQGTFKYSLDK